MCRAKRNRGVLFTIYDLLFTKPPSACESETLGRTIGTMPDLLTFRTLYDSPMIEVRDCFCRDTSHDHSAEEKSAANSIVLMRHGAFSRHFGKKVTTADVKQTTFFSKDSVYRVSHPGDCGDRGTSFVIAESILNDIIRELDPSVDENPDRPFPFTDGPCDT